MINIRETLQVQVARSSVWRNFADIKTWHLWNKEILKAGWVSGTPWQEGSVFAVEHRTLLGARRRTPYIVRMCVAERSALFESTEQIPLRMINSVQLYDSLGGCRLEATHSYSGMAAPLVWLLASRQQSMLRAAMEGLKFHIEAPTR